MVKSEIYIGLHDSTTKTQLFENEKYIRVLHNVCHSIKCRFRSAYRKADTFMKTGNMPEKQVLCLLLLTLKKPL